MPWEEVTVMAQRAEFLEQALREGANIRALCREFGITPRTGYKWLRRYQEEGEAGLYDRSRRPKRSPGRSGPRTEGGVLKVRSEHPSWGGRKIRWILIRQGTLPVPAASTITAILRRHDMIPPGEGDKHKPLQRFEMGQPNQLWQMDFKGHFEMANGMACHPLTVLDDHSRFLVGLRACHAERSRSVKQHLEGIFECYGLPERMLMDNGSVWHGFHTNLTFWLVRLGIQILHGRPHHPQTQGKDERLHRTLKDELLRREQFMDLPDCQDKFDHWRDLYNHARPHEALEMYTPASRYQPSPRPYAGTFPVIQYQPGDILRRSDVYGRVLFHSRHYHIGKAFRLSTVALRPTQDDGVFNVFFVHQRIAQIDLRKGNP
jgi:transposase InsO family protein